MEYKYSTDGYHSGKVSFEVEAFLINDAKAKALGAASLQNTILNTAPGNFNYSTEGYLRELELAFNPLTSQDATSKHLKHNYKKSAAYERDNALKQKKEKLSAWQSLYQHAILAPLKSLSSSIQNMLRRFIMVKKGLNTTKDVHISFLNIENAKNSIQKQAKQQVLIKTKYTLHPHVDALFYERSRSNRGRAR